MDFFELCQQRRSCRNFSDKPVEREHLLRCVEAARLAPSACNSQPWSFVIVRDPEKIAAIATTTRQLGLNEYTAAAQAFFVVVEEQAKLMARLRSLTHSQYYASQDIGGAVAMLCLQAQELGLGTCVIGIFDRYSLHELLDIPADKQIAVIVAVGYPEDGAVRPKIRKDIDEIARFVE